MALYQVNFSAQINLYTVCSIMVVFEVFHLRKLLNTSSLIIVMPKFDDRKKVIYEGVNVREEVTDQYTCQ